jgi:cell wall assembly regulator SMI1
MNSVVVKSWETIEAELRKQFPSVYESLSPPASEFELARLEKSCEVSLPDDFRASLLRHNGQRERHSLHGLVNGAELLNIEGILDVWNIWRQVASDPENFVHPDNDTSKEIATDRVWHPKWIPFTETADGNSHVMDLAPRRKGSVGQVFMHAHGECGDVMAKSFGQWLERVASKLRNQEFNVEAVEQFKKPWFSGLDV